MTESDLQEMMASRLEAIDRILQGMATDLGALKAAMHLPGDCDLAASQAGLTQKVNRLELAQARQGGMLAVVGVIAGLVASGAVTILAKLPIWGRQ